MAESVDGLFKTELHRNPGAWRQTADLRRASTTSRSPPAPGVSWFNEERLHGELNDQTPAEVEAEHRFSPQWHEAKRTSLRKPRPIHIDHAGGLRLPKS